MHKNWDVQNYTEIKNQLTVYLHTISREFIISYTVWWLRKYYQTYRAPWRDFNRLIFCKSSIAHFKTLPSLPAVYIALPLGWKTTAEHVYSTKKVTLTDWKSARLRMFTENYINLYRIKRSSRFSYLYVSPWFNGIS